MPILRPSNPVMDCGASGTASSSATVDSSITCSCVVISRRSDHQAAGHLVAAAASLNYFYADLHAIRNVQSLENVHRFRARFHNIYEALVQPKLKVFLRVLCNVR